MPAGHGFEPYGKVTKSEPASSVGARLMVQGQQGGAVDPYGSMSADPMAGPMGGPMGGAAFSPLPSQASGNPTSRPELMPGTDSSVAAAVGELLSRTAAGGPGHARPKLPALSLQDETLLNAGFTPEELELFRQMGGVK